MTSGIADEIRAAGGQVFAVTSEPQSLATEAVNTWELDFESIGDPHHEILQTCRDENWLDLFVNSSADLLQEARAWVSHPNGYFQPGLLALSKQGRVLYRWRCRPTHENIGGAIRRPTAEYAWAQIKQRLNGSAEERSEDAPIDADPDYDAPTVSWPIFMVLLLAHGWFLAPKSFPNGRQHELRRSPDQMFPRVGLFVVGIIAAFVLLPVYWVAIGLTAWGAYIWPKIARYNHGFQHRPAGDPSSLS
jgi:hypothetical protein